jgi:hypothetical protein
MKPRAKHTAGAGARLILLAAMTGLVAHGSESPPQVWAIADPPSRQAVLVGELAGADARRCAEWVAAIDRAPPCAARYDDRLVVVERWAELDPGAAQAYVDGVKAGTHHRQALAEALARGWTRHTPEAAWAWAKVQPAELELPKVVLATVAETAPERGLQWLRATATKAGAADDNAETERAFAFFGRLVELGDYATARRLLDAFPPGETKNQLLFNLAQRMAVYARDDTTRWARTRLGQPDALYALAATGIQWSRDDFAGAFAWVREVGDLALRVQLVRAVAGDVIERTPTMAVAEKILAQLPTPTEREAAYNAFALTADLVRVAPPQIMDWAAQIKAPNERHLALIRGYAAWAGFAPAAARAHLQAATAISPEDKAAVEKFLAGADAP